MEIRMSDRENWTFNDYYEQLIYLDEMLNISGVEDMRMTIMIEVWGKYPEQCEENGLWNPNNLKK
jgi:hypothetical protein